MSMRIEVAAGYPAEELIQAVCNLDIPAYPAGLFTQQLQHQNRFLGCYAYEDNDLIGYKIGYEPRPRYFESFLGAIRPDRRREGIALQLMELQHKWCENQGYWYITTTTAASNNAMIILNLKAGFVIAGTLLDRGKNHKVMLQKTLHHNENGA